MNKVIFKAKISKSGDSRVITIPAYFIRAELVDVKAEYNISLTKKKEVDKNGRGNSKTN